MTDATRLLENPVEATTIVQKFVLLLVKHCVMKKIIRYNKSDIKKKKKKKRKKERKVKKERKKIKKNKKRLMQPLYRASHKPG
jgi:hypothetical protein